MMPGNRANSLGKPYGHVEMSNFYPEKSFSTARDSKIRSGKTHIIWPLRAFSF